MFTKYPNIGKQIKETSERRYRKNIRRFLTAQRQRHIDEVNKESLYKAIIITEKHGQGEENDGATRNYIPKNLNQSFQTSELGHPSDGNKGTLGKTV